MSPGSLAGPVDGGLCSPACNLQWSGTVGCGRLWPDTGCHGPKQREFPLRWQPTDGRDWPPSPRQQELGFGLEASPIARLAQAQLHQTRQAMTARNQYQRD